MDIEACIVIREEDGEDKKQETAGSKIMWNRKTKFIYLIYVKKRQKVVAAQAAEVECESALVLSLQRPENQQIQ